MKLLDMAIGHLLHVTTDMQVVVTLTIERIEEIRSTHELTPATRENDWWPDEAETIKWRVHFTNGSHKDYDNLNRIDLLIPQRKLTE